MLLTITSLNKVLFHGEADSITVPGVSGEMTILKDHMPIVSAVKEGSIIVKSKENEEVIDINGGVLEVYKNVVTILS
jgi:F-type H+-transporting ATPase subunit epsilon